MNMNNSLMLRQVPRDQDFLTNGTTNCAFLSDNNIISLRLSSFFLFWTNLLLKFNK